MTGCHDYDLLIDNLVTANNMLKAVVALPPKTPHQKENTAPPSNRWSSPEGTLLAQDLASPEELLTPQTRILELRKRKFKAAAVPPRNPSTQITSSVFSPRTSTNGTTSLHDPQASIDSKVSDKLSETSWLHSPDGPNVLQEISNSSLRRKKNDRTPKKSTLQRARSDIGRSPPRTQQTTDGSPWMDYPALAENTFVPPVPESSHASPRSKGSTARRRRTRRGASKVHEDESTQYIEHLESQLACLQTQLQSLTSPSAAQSAKLRAMNNESRLLRQEVQDWEVKFNERLKDQTEQHEFVVGGLRAQLRSLERDAGVMQERLEVLEVEVNEKDSRIDSTEQANQELERRLSIMSELLAHSPGKLELCSENPMETLRRRSPTRPKSMLIPMTTSNLSKMSPPRRTFSSGKVSISSSNELHSVRARSPESPTLKRQSRRWSPDRRTSGTPSESDAMSESTLVDRRSISPTHRRLTLQRSQTDNDVRPRPTRQMRRFHGGQSGPRTLILPSTTSSGSLVGPSDSVSSSVQPTPILEDSPQLPDSAFRIAPELVTDTDLSRSTTLDEDVGSPNYSRRTDSVSSTPATATKKPRPNSTVFATPIEEVIEDDETDLKLKQASIGYADGISLFEEFKMLDRLQREASRSPPVSDAGSTTGTREKHQGSPCPSRPVTDIEEDWGDPGPSLQVRQSSDLDTDASTSFDDGRNTPPRTSPGILPRPFNLLTAFAAAIGRTLDRRVPSVSQTLNNAWDIVTLSRPVIAFRWWLIKLLIGDLHKRKCLWPPLLKQTPRPPKRARTAPERTTAGLGLGITSTPMPKMDEHQQPRDISPPPAYTQHSPTPIQAASSAPTAPINNDANPLREVLNHLDTVKDQEHQQQQQRRCPPAPPPPPVYWLRFGLTLVFAVGIALKDGPASLLVPVGAGSGARG